MMYPAVNYSNSLLWKIPIYIYLPGNFYNHPSKQAVFIHVQHKVRPPSYKSVYKPIIKFKIHAKKQTFTKLFAST